METELWKPIANHDGYEVSQLGRIRSWVKKGPAGRRRAHPLIVALIPDRTGHLSFGLKGGKKMWVHHAVMDAHGKPCPGERFSLVNPYGVEARHLDGKPWNNHIENLSWGSRSQNREDSRRHDTISRGERRPNAVLREDDIRSIRKSQHSQSELAQQYGVSQSTICRIRTRKRWAHVQD